MNNINGSPVFVWPENLVADSALRESFHQEMREESVPGAIRAYVLLRSAGGKELDSHIDECFAKAEMYFFLQVSIFMYREIMRRVVPGVEDHRQVGRLVSQACFIDASREILLGGIRVGVRLIESDDPYPVTINPFYCEGSPHREKARELVRHLQHPNTSWRIEDDEVLSVYVEQCPLWLTAIKQQ